MARLDQHLPYALRQFESEVIFPLSLLGWDISFTTASLAKVSTVLLIATFMSVATRRMIQVPGRFQAGAEVVYEFVNNTVVKTAGPEAKASVPFFFSIFIFVWVGSVAGLAPVKDTFTSHLAVTLALATTVFVYVNAIAFRRHGLGYLRSFVPGDSPAFVMPILALVEAISYFFRPLTMGFRLFANIVAGHIMLKLFADFCAMLYGALGTAGIFVSALPVAVMMLLFVFELMIISVQAYIFLLIGSVYLRDALHPHS